MRIEASSINMSSERTYSSTFSRMSASILTTGEQAAKLEFSDESKTLMEQLQENQKRMHEEQLANQKNNQQNALENLFMQKKAEMNSDFPKLESEEDFYIVLLKKILAALRGVKGISAGGERREIGKVDTGFKDTMRGLIKGTNLAGENGGVFSIGGIQGRNISSGVGGTVWTKTTVNSSFYAEHEHTAYQADGIVRTADGREINFGVTLEMSRSFCKEYEELTQYSYVVTDPLVINLDTNIATVTDQKFLFDLNSDGEEEEISFAGEGSGFLALDKNGDGKVNDGNELFGTQSGDGFKDLAEYDIDGNGWIDEADAVFKNLKVWTKDANGKDKLVDLKKAGVGAIYLGHASTQFSLKELETNKTNGIIRSTGVYLKENGEAGTIQHVDLAI